ncbi:ATP-dependent sacrificial sulfur transferase LarE [bacterium]|nr:ATP-dependent sacrificial sulfur transferase LarE [bacterium]
MTHDRIDTILADLERWFAACPSAVVAFSGGVDSSLVAYLARRHLGRDRCLAVVGDSPSLKRRDLDGAVAFAARHDIPLRVVATTELDDPRYRANPEDRCFHCKSVLFDQLDQVRQELGFAHVLGGENVDDHGDYRPGLRAVARFAVRGPLAECEVTKDELRQLARRLDLACWEKPASPCLSSRIPYFSEITGAKLRQIEAGEAWLEQRGFAVSRVRHHGTHARIEVPRDQVAGLEAMRADLATAFADLGFATVEIDPEGFVSGKLNRALG